MKALVIFIVLIMFNICLSTVINAGLITPSSYYENTIEDNFDDMRTTNFTQAEIEAQGLDFWARLANTLTFNWAFQYAEQLGLKDEFTPFIYGLNFLMFILVLIGTIELVFYKGSNILG